jgi:hypothetical protein
VQPRTGFHVAPVHSIGRSNVQGPLSTIHEWRAPASSSWRHIFAVAGERSFTRAAKHTLLRKERRRHGAPGTKILVQRHSGTNARDLLWFLLRG